MVNKLDIRKLFIVIIVCLTYNNGFAQLSTEELEELRKTPDTSKTVYMTEKTGEAKVSEEELNGLEESKNTKKPFNTSNVSSGFVVEAVPIEGKSQNSNQLNEESNGGVLRRLVATPYNSTESASSKNSTESLDVTALALAANCSPLSSTGSVGRAVVYLDEDSFFVIPTKPSDLPPFPVGGGTEGIHGVDVNKNCVRDDIEHYIFEKYSKKEQEKLRLNLYAHAIWLNFFLTNPISETTIQGIIRQNIKTGKCMNMILGEEFGRLARGDLFAYLHNTEQRTERYFENYELLRGFLIEEDIAGACL